MITIKQRRHTRQCNWWDISNSIRYPPPFSSGIFTWSVENPDFISSSSEARPTRTVDCLDVHFPHRVVFLELTIRYFIPSCIDFWTWLALPTRFEAEITIEPNVGQVGVNGFQSRCYRRISFTSLKSNSNLQ